jgi:hypothetical protein
MRRCIGPVLAAVGFHAALVAGYVAAYGGDLGALSCVGDERAGQVPYERIHTGFKKHGYDGQYYYAIARAPWQRHVAGIDAPAIRQARILYPALSWLLSAGDPDRLLWAMPLVNLLAIAGLAWLGASLAVRQGLSPWWGVLLPLAVNAGMPTLRNLTDVVSTLAVCGLLVTWIGCGPWLGLCLWAAAAVFCREQNAVMVILVLGAAVWRRQKHAAIGLAIVLSLWAGWLCILRLMYGNWPFLPGQGNLGLPLAGMVFRWQHLDLTASWSSALFHILGMLLLTLQIGLAIYLIRIRANRVLVLTAHAGAALAIVGGVYLYQDRWSYTRSFAWLPLGLWLVCLHAHWRWAMMLLSSIPLVLTLAVVARAWISPA